MSDPSTQSAAEITKRSKSNLAFAFACLPRQQREDMTTFYAFCRQVDDIADDPELPKETKTEQLAHWSEVVSEARPAKAPLEVELLELLGRYPIDRELPLEIIRGMEMDLKIQRYETYADLETYCYRVACAVGLVSIEIFGYENPKTRDYAVELGHALQLTNIIRDVGEDLREEGRIYLPQEDLRRFEITERSLETGQPNEAAFLKMMTFQADRAEERYQNALALLPREDRGSLRASELMRLVYHAILEKMRGSGFQVLDQRCRLTRWHKIWLLSKAFIIR